MRLNNKDNLENIHVFLKSKEEEYGLKISLIENNDAEFIFNLRNNFKARHLNGSVDDIDQQIDWIQEYKVREKKELEFYFIFWRGFDRIGTIRFIKMDEHTFESGSWLFIDDIPYSITVKAEFFCKDFAFEYYKYKYCYFYINKKNIQVIRYHNLFHPEKIREDKDHVFFTLSRESYYLNKNKILSFCQ
jgi:hypothetical protein